MTFRERNELRAADQEAYDAAKDFRALFNSPLGERVLDHILQRICGVDAITPITGQGYVMPEAVAFGTIARKNVGLEIARLALSRPDKANNVKVNT